MIQFLGGPTRPHLLILSQVINRNANSRHVRCFMSGRGNGWETSGILGGSKVKLQHLHEWHERIFSQNLSLGLQSNSAHSILAIRPNSLDFRAFQVNRQTQHRHHWWQGLPVSMRARCCKGFCLSLKAFNRSDKVWPSCGIGQASIEYQYHYVQKLYH